MWTAWNENIILTYSFLRRDRPTFSLYFSLFLFILDIYYTFISNISMKTNLFTLITKYLVIVLPFYVIIALYLQNIVGIPRAGFFLKEWMLVVLFWALVYEFIQAKKLPKIDVLDVLIMLFIIYWVWITLWNGLWIDSLVYGGRYDFMFLIVLLIYKHGREFLEISIQKLASLFLLSGGISLFLGFLVKFRFGENFLPQFGYVMYQWNWIFEWWVPAYHWLEGSWIRRFQWILDGPSAMGYFLILYSGIFLFLQKKKLEFYVLLIGIFFFILLLITYSRSALLGVIIASWLIFLIYLPKLYHHYKKYFLSACIGFLVLIGIMGITFQDQIENIIFRNSSTSAHFERMDIGIQRFLEKPLGAWLAESGPGFRSIYPDKTTKEDEEYYIPESWFIQVLIEGWIIYFSLFILIIMTILWRLHQRVAVFFWFFTALVVMNIFLHIFEATYLSILTFLFIWLFMNKK